MMRWGWQMAMVRKKVVDMSVGPVGSSWLPSSQPLRP